MTQKQKFVLHQSGLEISGEPETNLVVKAYLLLEQEFQLPPVDIYLYKHIPSGAGLGGGSANAAFMLKLLNEKFNLHLADEKLEEYAAILGADCAFLLKTNQPLQRVSATFFPNRFIIERISVGTCKTGCLCLDPRRLFTNTTSLPGSFIERNYKTSGKRMEKLHVQ